MRMLVPGLVLASVLCSPVHAQEAAKPVTPAKPVAFVADPAGALPRAKPEEVGLSSERLGEIDKLLNADIAAGRIPGAVLAVVRHGKLAYFEAFGFRDKAAGVPMTVDTIFNIASMTKPMTAVAALMLLEQGKLSIDDPLAKFFPKFADMQVAVMDAKSETIVEKVSATRRITIQDLMHPRLGRRFLLAGRERHQLVG